MRFLVVPALALLSCGPMMMTTDAGGGATGCDAVSPNFIKNAGFECSTGATTGWSAAYGTLELATGEGHTGNAAKLTVNASGLRLAYSGDAVSNGGTSTYCASAYVKGNVPFMRLQLRRSTGTGVEFAAPVSATWERVPPTIYLDAANEDSPRLLLTIEAQTNRQDGMNAMVGQTMYVDDVEVWRSANGRCTDHP